MTYFRSRRTPIQEVEEPEDTRSPDMEIGEEIPEDHEDHDMEEPQDLVEKILEKDSHKRKPTWARELIREAESYGAPEGIHRERKRANPYNSYVALLCDIIDKEPSTYGVVEEKKEWKDAMIEKYQSIMKNDVWEIVLRPKKKYVMTSKWIYGRIKKYKARFIA